MARWLLVALMFLLPAQFVWTAVATYCAHEATPTSFHVGHHDHKHQGDSLEAVGDEADGAVKPIFLEHDDCSYCQTGVAQFGMTEEVALGAPQAGLFVRAALQPYNFRVQEDIDRPKWTSAV